MVAVEERAVSSPNIVFEIQCILEDGGLVALHSNVQIEMETYAIMHIMQFDNNKIVELWDFGQAVPEEMISKNGMF